MTADIPARIGADLDLDAMAYRFGRCARSAMSAPTVRTAGADGLQLILRLKEALARAQKAEANYADLYSRIGDLQASEADLVAAPLRAQRDRAELAREKAEAEAAMYRERFGNQMLAGQEICDENDRLRAELADAKAQTCPHIEQGELNALTELRQELAEVKAENDRLMHGTSEWVRERIAPIAAERDDLDAENERLRSIVGGDGRLEHELGITLSGLNAALLEVRAERDAAVAKVQAVEALCDDADRHDGWTRHWVGTRDVRAALASAATPDHGPRRPGCTHAMCSCAMGAQPQCPAVTPEPSEGLQQAIDSARVVGGRIDTDTPGVRRCDCRGGPHGGYTCPACRGGRQ